LSSKNLISRSEAASLLGISTRTLDRYVKKKMLKSHRRGRHTMFVREDVEALLEEPAATQSHVVSPSAEKTESLPQSLAPEMTAFAGLIKEMNEQIQTKDMHIAKLNYELGKLQEIAKNSVPLLEMRNEKKEHDSDIRKMEKEIGRAKTGRFLFFILFILSLGAVGILANMIFGL
jgi:excisionase family DNA binding protein